MRSDDPARFDVVIVGGGLAGLSLARQLLLSTQRTVLLLERLPELPPKRQKVGESTVQLAGYYFSRVLELEEHLMNCHYLKYNLRFYWPSAGRSNQGFEDVSQGFIRDFSNVASYQVDRNVLEGELFRLCSAEPRFRAVLGANVGDVELGTGAADHRVRFTTAGGAQEVQAGWVVDTSGRNRLFAKRRQLLRPSPIRHGTYFWWVEGLIDIEKLSSRSGRERRLDPSRRTLGHLPSWLATNHFVGEGFWFWVIPLHGKTSLGLVYDRAVVDLEEINKPEKASEWVIERFPFLARELRHRKVLDASGYRSYAHDCGETLSAERWAMTGEAGRFTDPLYSPGSDLIAIYNTLVVDAIETEDPTELAAKVRAYEQLQRAVYGAYLPSYVYSYDVLGDPEAFFLKYTWELAVYFVFYVFPFINDLFTDRRFIATHLRAFSRLGPINHGLQKLLSAYYQWKKPRIGLPEEPIHFDFNDLGPLARARTTFYQIGIEVEEARKVLAEQLENLDELARFLYARIASVVLDEPRVLESAAFVAGIDPAALRFDPEEMARRWEAARLGPERHRWSFDPAIIERFPTRRLPAAATSREEVEVLP
ncbi:MAG TPA: lycopene cyclase family protein [Thermoanaerobaculia bacterium]|nr:lycopene cyclase family protein [Thermoanaerobaculia bacterium]